VSNNLINDNSILKILFDKSQKIEVLQVIAGTIQEPILQKKLQRWHNSQS
jgi:hypothetical protein